jgi:hypothetical protein
VLELLEGSSFSAMVREQIYGWPLFLTIHAFGTALVIGLMLILGLRVMGIFSQIPFATMNRMVPVVWGALCVQFISGFVLWAAKPTRYVVDGAFLLKVILIIAGIVLTRQFQAMLEQEATVWENKGAVSPQVTTFAAASFLVWCGVLIAGRLTGFLGSI